MESRAKKAQQCWLESEDEIWTGFRRWERRKRDLLWLLVSLLLMVVGSYTGFPARFFTGCPCG